MMRCLCIVWLLVILVAVPVGSWTLRFDQLLTGKGPTPKFGVNGAIDCAVCSIGMSILEQYVDFHHSSVTHTLATMCQGLPSKYQRQCRMAVKFLTPLLLEQMKHDAGPDVVCHALQFCYTEPEQPVCRSVVPPQDKYKTMSFEEEVLMAKQRLHHIPVESRRFLTGNICDIPGISEICDMIKRVEIAREPLIDNDGDGFSTILGLRGTAWRGKDCDDLSEKVHPGAIPLHQDRDFDSNCNGIYGVNNLTQRAYEEELCGNSQPRGVAILGDSIGAHFHLPRQWLDATVISKEAFTHFQMIAENNFDWPMLSTATGYVDNKWPEVISGPMDSLYIRLRERNRCNHRDYQNIAANGEKSSSMAEQLVKTLSRDPQKDQPLVVNFALVGNDVCNRFKDAVAHMTTPEEMYKNTMETLYHLNGTLPKNSYVLIMGLVDGRFLFDTMHDRIHPLGNHWGGFTYAKFYDFFNCLQISPCSGWLNTNATMRDLTSERAAQLSKVLEDLVMEHEETFSNFRLRYGDCPLKDVVKDWEDQGGKAWELVDVADGFHNNQLAQSLVAKFLWNKAPEVEPHLLGPENPNNAMIQKLFGDQGGY